MVCGLGVDLKKKHQIGMCIIETALCAQNTLTIIGSIVNKNGGEGSYMTI